ncbi:MAG: hypothetical protein XXXJIFNMEKO3_00435 [Candidatus Erwinia impunctatus]|nr:hypothetical protein XXXJIFNMEKO_00435 [Culicoides impunctatus]
MRIVLLCAISLLSGCATIVGKSTQDIPIQTSPPGAVFVVQDENGRTVAQGCSGQLILATRPDCSWNSRSDSFGVKPPLYQWGRMAL